MGAAGEKGRSIALPDSQFPLTYMSSQLMPITPTVA